MRSAEQQKEWDRLLRERQDITARFEESRRTLRCLGRADLADDTPTRDMPENLSGEVACIYKQMIEAYERIVEINALLESPLSHLNR